MAKNQKRPEDFLELVERAKRGRLKVYIGSAAGVGKTYQMLEEAHACKKRGVDVVLAFIETARAADTAALIEGLEVVPRQRVDYRGVVVEEMDLDAVLKRRPQVAIVDELAHTNAPFCKNKKRYQDVLELLEAGINVICAFNVQHLESLNEMVKQATSVVVRETVPDSILKRADQVVDIDLAVEDLIDRLQSGKNLCARQGWLGAGKFFNRKSLRCCGRSRFGRSRKASIARFRPKPATKMPPQGGGERKRDGLSANAAAAARRHAAQTGLALGGTVEHGLVCRPCRDQKRSRSPDRRDTAAVSSGGRTKSAGLGSRSRAPALGKTR